MISRITRSILPLTLRKRAKNLATAALVWGGAMAGHNVQAQFFVDSNAGFPGLKNCSATWADIDDDGDLDVALSGVQANGKGLSAVYVNNGSSFTAVPDANFTFAPIPQLDASNYHNLEWGDFNNDNRMDLAMVGVDTNNIKVAKIFRNDGNNNFFNVFDFPPGTYDDVEWADVDGDGDQDLLLVGREDLSDSSVVWLNQHNQSSVTFQKGARLSSVSNAVADFGDYDGDGDLDVVIAGLGNASATTELWNNDGSGNFSKASNTNLPGIYFGDLDWFDANGDGNLDLLVSGIDENLMPLSGIYFNTPGAATLFDTVKNDMAPGAFSSTSLGDYDYDGDIDVLIAGDTNGNFDHDTRMYQNDGTGTMILDVFGTFDFSNIRVSEGTVELIDHDGDGDLDVFVGGILNNFTPVTALYTNVDTGLVNLPPAAPSNMLASPVDGGVEFTWDAPTDDVSAASLLSYHLSIEELTNNFQMTSPLADTMTGKRKVASFGEISGTTWTLRKAEAGKSYCAKVTAIDAGKAGSAFSTSSCNMVLGTNDLEETHVLQAWPQPAQSELLVRAEGRAGIGQLELMTLDGRVLQMHTMDFNATLSLDVRELPAGMFLLRLQIEDQQAPTVLKFIKQ